MGGMEWLQSLLTVRENNSLLLIIEGFNETKRCALMHSRFFSSQ